MTRKEELIAEGLALATDYFYTCEGNNGKRISEVFSEYFDLVKNDDVVDKKMIGAAMVIVAVHDRNFDYIRDEVAGDAHKMDMFLHSEMENWGAGYIGKIEGGKYFKEDGYMPSFDFDELLDLIKADEAKKE